MEQALKDAGSSPEIDEVIPGGRPDTHAKVQDMSKTFFGKESAKGVQSREVVGSARDRKGGVRGACTGRVPVVGRDADVRLGYRDVWAG